MGELQDIVIEDLVDSDFQPKVHEAYAYISDRNPTLVLSRVGGFFLRQLEALNWDEIEKRISEIKS